ncbi:hypothetical protein GGI12_002241 [Dipsacomyces acuminosporus]|nr:hypothetical protein GGI12_002241 [Dipsacomyces acuminosporus]
MIVVIFGILAITTVPVILAWIHRDYRPVKAKNLVNITLLLISGIGWSIGGMVINSLVPIVGVWSKCMAWVLWVRLTCTYVFFFLLLFRTYTLHRIFILNKPCRGWGFYAPIIIYAVFQLSFNIISQLLPSNMTYRYLADLEMCAVGRAYHIWSFILVLIMWLVHTIYMVLIRSIRSSFNEFRESLFIFFSASGMVVEIAVLHLGIRGFPLHLYARIVSAVCDTLCIITPVWILLSYPLYQCLFNRDKYLREWVQKLQADGMGIFYDRQDGNPRSSISPYSKMETGYKSEKSLAMASVSTAATRATAVVGDFQSPNKPKCARQPNSSEISINDSVPSSSLSTKPLK